ncbi:helix-turn-helix DNA binding protein [Gordonia phage Marietta]|uniref:Helix-turn-helix DNA binding protein n=1 Tax=Gordonia phage Marietta TaxID=2301558 RepID=A0A385DRB4_9CAUD|nr:helix-turn-helix DNA binding protein [Gordonia phage Marietta]AXQ61377.1 helix-turn-helix DNA binding protein [Gordonia phage Marietta]
MDTPDIDTLVSVDQAATLLGVPSWVLRRCLRNGMKTLPMSRTAGSHMRIPVSALLDHAEDIVEEIRRWRMDTARRSDSRNLPRKGTPEGITALRKQMKETMDANTAATLLGVSRPTLRRWEREGKIIGFRPLGPKQVRYSRESIEALVDAGSM